MQPLQMRYSKGLKNKQNGLGENYSPGPLYLLDMCWTVVDIIYIVYHRRLEWVVSSGETDGESVRKQHIKMRKG